VGQALARPDRQLQPRLEVEERDRPVLELLADDAGVLEAESVAGEAEGPFQVIDA
jgi:hypothetical protein